MKKTLTFDQIRKLVKESLHDGDSIDTFEDEEFPLECPFCHKPMNHGTTPARSVARNDFGYYVHCSYCGYSSASGDSPEEAIRAHNELVDKVNR